MLNGIVPERIFGWEKFHLLPSPPGIDEVDEVHSNFRESLFTLIDRWRYGGNIDICTEGLPASKLVACVPIMVLKLLCKAFLANLTEFLPTCLPTSLEAEPLELSD